MIKQSIGQNQTGEARFAWGFSVGEIYSDLDQLESSMVNRGMVEHRMLDLGAPENFRYVISTYREMNRYFTRCHRARMLESEILSGIIRGSSPQTVAMILVATAAKDMGKFTAETFVNYAQSGEETV